MDLSQPLTYEEGAVGPVRKGLNEFDVDLYLPVGNSRLLAQLPGLHSSDQPANRLWNWWYRRYYPIPSKTATEPHTGRYNAAGGTPEGTQYGRFFPRSFSRGSKHLGACSASRCCYSFAPGRLHSGPHYHRWSLSEGESMGICLLHRVGTNPGFRHNFLVWSQRRQVQNAALF